ncbi:MAG: sulfite exporter TauE/SafE family protein [Halobacteria archaeon]|nr:sulfite exporter TauE/SafE family protein [Halobacteria archaeon]
MLGLTIGSDGVGLALFFLIGLLGGAHCLGMCGPLVMLYSSRIDEKKSHDALTFYEIRQHALFNLGRTVSYALIGAAMGVLGTVFFSFGEIADIGEWFQAATGVGIGVLIAVSGVSYVVGGSGGSFDVTSTTGGVIGRALGALKERIDERVQGPGILVLGMLHGLLPCPIIYPAYFYAFGTGSPVEGFVYLAVLGLGTFPTLFVYGTFFQSLGAERRASLHRVLGVVFIVLGYMTFSMGLSAIGISLPSVMPPFYQPLQRFRKLCEPILN